MKPLFIFLPLRFAAYDGREPGKDRVRFYTPAMGSR
jgi:hypothetical protein